MAGLDPDALIYDAEFWLRPAQLPPADDFWIWMLSAGRGAGKALALDTPIPTPSGWMLLGDLNIGDEVFDEWGKICRVQAVFDSPHSHGGVFELEFSDGTTLVADGDHQWVTWTHAERKKFLRAHGHAVSAFPVDWAARPTRTTSEVIETFVYGKRGDRNHCIPVPGALELPEADLPIDPYLLGYWLGDGDSKAGVLHVGDDDLSHVVAEAAAAGEPCKPTRRRTAWAVSLTNGNGTSSHSTHLTKTQRYEILAAKGRVYAKDLAAAYGVPEHVIYSTWERDSWMRTVEHAETFVGRLRLLDVIRNKHIPQQYLRASRAQRLALIQGLMDSDGSVTDGRGHAVEFSVVSERLAQDTLELVRSLGEKPTFAKGTAMLHGVDCGPRFRVTWRPAVFMPFRLSRKAQKVAPLGAQALRNRHRMLVGYRELPDAPMRCITVDSPNSMYLAGEGMIPTHNSRAAAEWVRKKAREMPGSRGALVARTAADVRDVIVYGDSGLMSICPPDERPLYEPSKRLLTFPNGTTCLMFSSEEPSQLRGPQFHWGYCEELASWRWLADDSGLTAFDNLKIAVRLGDRPQIVIATTPKRISAIRQLFTDAETHPRIWITRGRTSDNVGNLSKEYVDTIYGMYEGTALAAQELEGLMLDNVEGALWTQELLDEHRVTALPPSTELFRPVVVIGVDPSVAENPRDECGIVVVVGTTEPGLAQRHVYVMEDASLLGSPRSWAERVALTARKWGAVVVAEVNQGGALVRTALENVDPGIRVVDVHSRVGKALRAEPVQLASQQGRVHMVGEFPILEEQLCAWIPEVTRKSPDRLDALVHAATAILTADTKRLGTGTLRASTGPRRRARERYARAGEFDSLRATAGDGRVLEALPPHMRQSLAAYRRNR